MKKILFILLVLPCLSFAQCPVHVVKYRLAENEIGSPVIVLTYKNDTKKKIDAFTFSLGCYDNFNDPVTDISGENVYTGISQDVLNPGKRQKGMWTMYLFDNATKITAPEIIKVHFTDGTTWQKS